MVWCNVVWCGVVWCVVLYVVSRWWYLCKWCVFGQMQTRLPLTLGVARRDPTCMHRGASCQVSCRWPLSRRVRLCGGAASPAVPRTILIRTVASCCLSLCLVFSGAILFLPAHHTTRHFLPGFCLAVSLYMWYWWCDIFRGQREKDIYLSC